MRFSFEIIIGIPGPSPSLVASSNPGVMTCVFGVYVFMLGPCGSDNVRRDTTFFLLALAPDILYHLMSVPGVPFSPLDEALNSLAPSSEQIRRHRKAVVMFCSGCRKTDGGPLRKCAKCHTALYCSKECQTRDWPVHKKMCGGEVQGALKLLKTMMSNPVLYTKLLECFVLAFDLLRRTRRDEMLLANVNIAVEPANIDDFEDMLLRNGSSKNNILGMLQVNAVTASADPQWFVHGRRELWCSHRAMADSAGCHADTVVIMDVIHANAQMSMTIPLRISKDILTVLALGGGDFTNISSVTGDTTTAYTVECCLEFINAHIRADKHNQLLLRTKMRPADIQVIRDTANYKDMDGGLVERFHAKIARESVYRKIYQKFIERRKAVTGVIISPPVLNMLCR
ncbi:Zinc finger, MYND-type [Mycena sanguinolenta]|uniref:Zinc finger, MYND-type n=1 Tax=Mycena sanguinolenta TaxID=230812 RepID=A0A8H6X8C4_9AGAR|nr:Zinc finger, MYND-type [Mycena sanguinolenta]